MTILELSLIASAPLMASAVSGQEGTASADGSNNDGGSAMEYGTGGAHHMKHHHKHNHHHGGKHHHKMLKAAADKWSGTYTLQCDLVLGAVQTQDKLDDDGNPVQEAVKDAEGNTIPQIIKLPDAVPKFTDDWKQDGTAMEDFNITDICAGGLLVQQWENLNPGEQKAYSEAYTAQTGTEPNVADIKKGLMDAAKWLFYACDYINDNFTKDSAQVPFYFENWQGNLTDAKGLNARGLCGGVVFAGKVWEYTHDDAGMAESSGD